MPVVALTLGLLALDLTLFGISQDLRATSCNFEPGFWSLLVALALALAGILIALIGVTFLHDRWVSLLAIAAGLSPFVTWYLAVTAIAPDHSWFICPS